MRRVRRVKSVTRGFDELQQGTSTVLLLDGSRAEAKVDRAAANSWKPSVANVMTRTRGRLALCP
jgi:hypothetical protein